MKIDSEQLLATVNRFRNEPSEKNETAAGAGEKGSRRGTDRVELSTNGTEINRLKKNMQGGEDVRSDKVSQLREQIAAGTYQVDSKAVAAKMLQSWSDIHDK